MTDTCSAPAIPPHRTWLKKIELLNFRCFERISLELDEHLTVLTAHNGAGKTAILDGIAVAFGSFVGSFYTGRATPIEQNDVRLRLTSPKLFKMEPQYPSAVKAFGEVDGQEISWARYRNTPKGDTTRKEARPITAIGERLQKSVTDNAEVVLPLVAYYGTGRLWKQKKLTVNKEFNGGFHSVTVGYLDCLDPASGFKYFEQWFRYAARANADLREQQRERQGDEYAETDTSFSPLLASVRQAVDECLSLTGWLNLRWSFTHQAVVMEHAKHGVLEVSQLSDGVRNMVALIADIAYRAVQLNSGFGRQAAQRTPGLVLIDEIDMHLHPEWQQTVLQNLTTAFPQIQFIVTTHSPQVLSTVKHEQIRVITENIQDESIAATPAAHTYGRSNADVLQTVMGVSPEPELAESKNLERYQSIIEQGNYHSDAASELRKELEQIFGADHPSLVRADMTMRRRMALGK